MTQIQIDWSRAQETKRHNVATEAQAANELAETNRHNVVTEVETNRHNVAGEKETKRHDKATEGETHRHNVKTESIEKGKLKETKRHNKQSESLEKGKLKESVRHNKKTEAQTDVRVANETRKTNAEIKKLAADVSYTQSKDAFQKFTNNIDMSDPALFTANRFSNVFKKGAEAAWIYYGLETASTKQKKALDEAASKGGKFADKAVSTIDSLNYQKNGKHLSSEDRRAWYKIFSLGKDQHGGGGGKIPKLGKTK